MQSLKNAVIPTLVVLLAASIVIALLWGVSKTGLADGLSKGSGREITDSTSDTTASTDAGSQASPQDRIRAIAAFLKVRLLSLLKVTILMGVPGVLTVIIVNRMKQGNRESDGA